MNRHLYGGSKGLPLSSLDGRFKALTGLFRPSWHQHSSARIVNGELFVRVVYTIEAEAAILRKEIKKSYHKICPHVRVAPTRSYSIASTTLSLIPELSQVPRNLLWQTGHLSGGSCPICLTDFTMLVAQADGRDIEVVGNSTQRWRIEITSYHQFGHCRDIKDWKWQRLTGDTTLEFLRHAGATVPDSPIFSHLRDMSWYPHGSVRRLWHEGEDEARAVKRREAQTLCSDIVAWLADTWVIYIILMLSGWVIIAAN